MKLRFVITQHSCDIKLMKSLIKYFNCGRVEIAYERLHVNFVVPKFTDIEGKIISFFFNKYPLQGVKNLDLEGFCKVVELMKDKLHLTNEGLEQIRKIKLCNNANRKQA